MDQDKQKLAESCHAQISFDEFTPTTYDEWKQEAVETLKGAPFEKRLLTKTYEGITLEPIYTKDHLASSHGAEDYPGFTDFIRGVKASGYLTKPWAVTVEPAAKDPISLLAETGALSSELDTLYDAMAEAVRNAPAGGDSRVVCVSASVYHNGGANAVQELAFAFSTVIAYIDALTGRGLTIDEIAPQISVNFSIGANFFMEISKLRAARTLWAKIISAYGGSDESQKLSLFAETSRFTQTKYDPYVNILRATTQAFSAVVGGVDSLYVAPFDGSGASELSRRVARNIQLMFQNEFDMLRPVDPAGGSWAVETLTRQLCEAAWAQLQKLDAAGGIVENLKNGSVQADVSKILAERLKNLATRADRAVGTNMYANVTEAPLAGHGFDDAAPVPGKGAVTVAPILPHRWTEEYELLRGRTGELAKTGGSIKVFLANMGPLSQHKARADFSTGFLEVACFEIIKPDGFMTAQDAAVAALDSGADVTVICSTDDTYPDLVPPIASAIKAARPGMTVLLAGAPAAEHINAYKESGVDDFIHVRANCFEILQNIQRAKGLC